MPAEVTVATPGGHVEPVQTAEAYGNDSQRPSDDHSDDEGVEVVMDSHGKSAVVDHNRNDVFRAPHPVRPRAMRAGHGPPNVKSAGSFGYPPSSEYGRPYPVPYAPSGSFDDGFHHSTPSHYSPHVQYPPPGTRHPDDVNVISPNHGHQGERPPMAHSRRYGHYQYPPTSPVSNSAAASSPPRVRNYAMRRPEGPYSAATRGRGPPEDRSWNHYGTPTSDRSRPPLVTESSFDSDHFSSHASHVSHPNTPNAPHYAPPVHRDPHYGGGPYPGSFGGSFDSHGAPPPPPPHFDDYRYYGHPPHHPPESPYSAYSYRGYSPGGYYDHYTPQREYLSYDDDKRYGGHPHAVTPNERKKDSSSGLLLPKAAQEIDFEVTDPPMEPTTPASKAPVCESPADINPFDVLCGRGGGTNSQVGNRRFRKLVQDFQPIYLLARRKEKPLLARTIVLIIRKRGGRFLKKDEETGELYEVGDAKAEAKTSQALREGLDVRATKNAASNLLDKKKKKKGKNAKEEQEDDKSDESAPDMQSSKSPEHSPSSNHPQSPPTLPRLNVEEKPSPRAPSPDQMHYRKRRRMRSADAADETEVGGCGGFQDKFFSDFCPPRAEIGRPPSPPHHMGDDIDMATTPIRSNSKYDDDDDDDDIRESVAQASARGCAGIAMDLVTGAATGSFCLGPRSWR